MSFKLVPLWCLLISFAADNISSWFVLCLCSSPAGMYCIVPFVFFFTFHHWWNNCPINISQYALLPFQFPNGLQMFPSNEELEICCLMHFEGHCGWACISSGIKQMIRNLLGDNIGINFTECVIDEHARVTVSRFHGFAHSPNFLKKQQIHFY